MTILLDIDGVLVIEPSWKKVEIGTDGFMLFNKRPADNLTQILSKTNASIVLTTTHRISFTIAQWRNIFSFRGINIDSISKIDNVETIAQMANRGAEIKAWVENNKTENYIIIDDDKSINDLPSSITTRWIRINPIIGIDEEAAQKAIDLYQSKSN